MNVIILCEFSGEVRDAFIGAGHYAISCDLLPSEKTGPHIQGDCRDITNWRDFDILIAHPECTYLTVSGNRWMTNNADRQSKRDEAVKFVEWIWSLPVPKKVLENPIGRLSSLWMKPTQIIQPWQFGHGEIKATCLWLDRLPKLVATDIVDGRVPRVHHESPGPERKKNRSRTLAGVADAMARQWGMAESIIDSIR